MNQELFWLGTHKPNWLWEECIPVGVPLFVSYLQLAQRATMQGVERHWALDSGGFSEIRRHGRWTVSPKEYTREVRWMVDNIGGMVWAAQQDWMCEPFMLERTGLTIKTHQRRTVRNYLRLRSLDATLPFIPVLQGWESDDYMRHIEMFERAGVVLGDEPLVGIGSVCRRQHTSEIGAIISRVALEGINLHGFGVKMKGLERYGDYLSSADSLAWSYQARYSKLQMPGCTTHKNCANCSIWALEWRDRLLERCNG